MKDLKWDEKYSVKVVELDDQHKRLIDLINKLYKAYLNSKNEDTLSASIKELDTQFNVLEELMKYTIYHFKTEEKYLLKYQYPGYELHKREHENLTSKVISMKNDFEKGEAINSKSVILFLMDWLIKHILGSDKQYVLYLNKSGLY
jgi:hemerythrin